MDGLLEHLNEQQLAAVTHPGGPAMILAGAGSGKTSVLTHRAAWLIQEKLAKPESLALVTFTNKAASEMKKRVTKLTGAQLKFVGTFHSLCARILRRYGQEIGLAPNFSIYDTQDQAALIKSILKEKGWSTKEINPNAVKATISEAKNQLVTPEKYAAKARGKFQENVAVIYKLYQHELNKQQAVDFDDMLMLVVKLFEKSPQTLAKLQTLFSHVLVDEYQDTNRAQYLISRALAMPQRELFVVGDFAQSIYAWRGADYKNMMTLKNDFPDIKEYRLERNYRSTQQILDAATQVISQTSSHPILELWTDQSDGAKISLYEASDRRDEAKWVINQIDFLRSGLELKEMAVLYRTNAQSRAFEEALVKAGIPYKVIGGLKFYERKEVKDLLSFLRLVNNPTDRVSLERLTKAGKRRLQAFQTWLDKQMLEKDEDEKNSILTKSPDLLLHQIIEVTGYADQYSPKDPEDLSRLENIDELIRVAKQFTNLNNFLENVALIQNDTMPDVEGEEQDQVNLMSLHAAKGLEFGAVFLAGLEEGLLPHNRSQLDPEQLEEERRLMYVGITRAKSKLHLSYSRLKEFGGGYNLRSRFVNDIDPRLLEIYGQKQTNSKPTPTAADVKRRLILDDDQIDQLLDGELDIAEYIRR